MQTTLPFLLLFPLKSLQSVSLSSPPTPAPPPPAAVHLDTCGIYDIIFICILYIQASSLESLTRSSRVLHPGNGASSEASSHLNIFPFLIKSHLEVK